MHINHVTKFGDDFGVCLVDPLVDTLTGGWIIDWFEGYEVSGINPVVISTGNYCGYQHVTWSRYTYFTVIISYTLQTLGNTLK
jgi:hypothetical protein